MATYEIHYGHKDGTLNFLLVIGLPNDEAAIALACSRPLVRVDIWRDDVLIFAVTSATAIERDE